MKLTTLRREAICLGLTFVGVALAGCTKYYAVENIGDGRTYLTTSKDYQPVDGKVRFRDALSGNSVTLEHYRRRELTQKTYELSIAAGHAMRANDADAPQGSKN